VANSIPRSRWIRAAREVLVFGVAAGLLIFVLKLTEYRFLVLEHSFEIYAGLIAALAVAVGIWLGRSLRRRNASEPSAAQLSEPFAPDATRLAQLGLTPRELEILGLIASGLSNREIGEKLFVSENTVKTHASRLFDKLGARRRTQAVQMGKAARLIP
jgi:DNA-binding NarL/FixJ family response regulator